MKLPLYQINAFTDELFKGNPACVVPLDYWLDDDVLLKIALENAVAETAFMVKENDNIHLRWFTPDIEMDLCGHATLAAAHCLKKYLAYSSNEIKFNTASGELTVYVKNDLYTLNLPARVATLSSLPENIKLAINIQPIEILKSRDYILVYETEQQVKDININRKVFDEINLDPGGLVVTAKGDNSDFVSRYFTPQSTILEDPVTGSSHCSLIPYWANFFQKDELTSLQLSKRTGKLYCKNLNNRVAISGSAKTYSIGHLWIN